MGISRRLPRADEERTVAINKAKQELGTVIPAEITVTNATKVRLLAMYLAWKGANDNIQIAEFAKTTATALVESTKETAAMFIRHFIMVFNMGVERGVYTAEQRTFFYLDVANDALPAIVSEADITLWGNRIIDGDALRVAAGGAAMSNPTAAEVGTAFGNFNTANIDQEVKTADYKAKLLVRTNLREDADAVILKIWDETETFYNELPAETKRDKCRPWGIVYISDVEVTINVEILKDGTTAPVDGASTNLAESDTTRVANSAGMLQFKTTVADLVTLITNKPGFVQNTTVVNFVPGQVLYSVTVMLVPV